MRLTGYSSEVTSDLSSGGVGSHIKEMSKMGEESFALIEKKITDLVHVVAALKKEKENLAAELARKDGEVKELTRKLNDLSRERVEVKEKVEKILSRLDTIEL
jgi:predicted nuclease with TOPRIM domain